MKKTISLFLTLLMLLSLMPMATFAEGLNTPSFAINSVEATPGDTVKVSISVKNNPGIASAAIEITFDDGLVLVGAENGDTFPTYMNYSSPGQLDEGKEMTGRCGFSWMLNNPRTLKDSDIKDGIILTLTFRVSDASEIGDVYSITLSSTDGDIINKNLQIVKMQSVQGTITVIDYIPGDVDNDGNIVMLDAITICCYIVDGRRYDPESYAITLNEKAADVDDDGNITMLDAIMICCYIVDGRRTDPESYNIVLKPSTKRCQHEMQATEAKSKTCTEDGNIAYWHCTLCDKYFSDADGAHVIKIEDTVIAATGHTLVIDPAVPATETTTGLTEGSHCSVCGVVFREQEVIPMIQPNTAGITYKLVNNDSYLAAQTINNPNPSTYVIGKGVKLSNDIEVPGYTFVGWFDSFDDSAAQIKSISANETDEVILFAHWQTVPFDINFETDSKLETLLPIPSETYTVNKEKVLPSPNLPGYSFVGWSDDEGNIIRRIPVGTTGDKVYSANWLSDRNQARTKKNVGGPTIILEEDNKILFSYEIGEIRNVPVSVISDFGHIIFGGVTKEETVTHSKTVSSSEVKSYTKTVANATTENHGITLSRGWSEGMSVDQEYYEEHGQWNEELNSIAKTESENWNISSGSSGSTSTVKYDSAQETDMNTSTKNKSNTGGSSTSVQDTHTSENHKDISVTESATLHVGGEVDAGIAKTEMSLDAQLASTQSWGGSESDAHAFGQTFNTSGTVSDGSENQKGKVTHTGSDTTTTGSWNSSSSRGGSSSVTTTTSTNQRISELTSEKTKYGQTYIGTESEAYYGEVGETTSNSSGYSTGTTYSSAETEEFTEKISTTNTMTGYHRWVWATTAHVFLVVGYDIKTSAYFVSNYSILDDDVKRFEDYSYDNSSFDDNQTGVIQFEIPTDIRDYVADRVSGSSGLQYSRDGKVTGYTGSDDFVIIPEYRVINGTVIKVKGIAENAFKGKVRLPDTQVTNAEGDLETITPELTAIQLSDFITEIPDNAFSGCSSLKFIDCSNVTRIGTNAFAGCTGLKVARISDKVTYLGENAFEGLDGIVAKVANKSVAEAVACSGAKVIAIVVSKKCNDLNNTTLSIPQGTEYFGFIGALEETQTFSNIKIISNAETTEIANAVFENTKGVPLQLSSKDIVLDEIEVVAPGFALTSTEDNANLYLYGESWVSSAKGNAILSRCLVLKTLDEELYSQLYVNGNLLIRGSIEQNGLISFSNGEVVYLTEEEFQKYLSGTYTITFDANGGSVSETERVANFGTQTDPLPTPTRDYYIFDGWYSENGSGFVTPETLLSNAEDITLVAHWTDNPLSGWVEASEAPSDAQIVNTKYSYNSWKTSSNPTMSGYTRDDSRTTYTISWSNTEWYDSQQSTSETFRYVGTRSVENGTETYLYNYYNSSKGTTSMTPRSGFSEQGYWAPSSEVYWWDFYNGGWTTDYLRYELWGYPANKGDTRTVYKTQYGYQRGTKNYTYWFYKPVETTSQPTASSTVTNITKWVQYRPKTIDGNYTESNRTTFNGHTYVLYTSSSAIKWSDAKIWCEFAGGHLAVITSSAENNLVKSLTGDTLAWLGLSKTPASNWEWTNGEAFSYSDWKSGEPNCYSNNEWYAATLDRQWNDNPNSTTSVKAFVMEIEHA